VTDEVWATVAQNKDKVDLASITGTYQDKWFGDVVISEKELFFASKRSSQLSGEVFSIKKEIMW
jgi:hypothetical protein